MRGARRVIPAADEYQRELSFGITEALAKRKSPKDSLDTTAREWDKVTESVPERRLLVDPLFRVTLVI